MKKLVQHVDTDEEVKVGPSVDEREPRSYCIQEIDKEQKKMNGINEMTQLCKGYWAK
jgi:hypothetical protein